MTRRSQRLFLLLVMAQAAHSVEEYLTRLYDTFAPARFVSGLVSDDVVIGFVIVNAIVVAVAVWCYLFTVRSNRSAARVLAWFWVVFELANGLGHIVLALQAGGYFPGVLTGGILLCVAAGLGLSLATDRKRGMASVAPGGSYGS